jgi:phosphoribosylformylglycinamidine synthase
MFEIEVCTKKGFKNSRGEHVLSDISGIGIESIIEVEYSPLYVIDGGITSAEAETIAFELLSDKITETYICCYEKQRIEESLDTGFFSDIAVSKTAARAASVICQHSAFFVVDVWYKKGVTDTVSESVIKAVKDLGIEKEIKVKTGRKYYLYGKVSKTVLNYIATKLLANTLVQEYVVQHNEIYN